MLPCCPTSPDAGPAPYAHTGSGASRSVVLAVELDPDLDRFASLRAPMAVGVAQRVDASAVLLLVERFALADLDHARRAAALAPVVGPVHQIGIARCRPLAAAVDLVHVLPARDAQRAGNGVEAVFVGVKGGALETHVEADGATGAALMLVFEARDALEPVVAVVVGVDELDAVLFGKTDVLVFADFVFAVGVD